MQRESLNETREQSREDKGEDGERKMRPPPLRAKEKDELIVMNLLFIALALAMYEQSSIQKHCKKQVNTHFFDCTSSSI